MNVSNESLFVYLTPTSPQDLSIEITVLTLSLATWTTVTNGFLLIFCFVNRKMKSEKHFLRTALFVADFVYGLGQIVDRSDRLRLYYFNITSYTAYYCLTISITALFGSLFSLCIVCAMALERLTAIGWPYLYRGRNKKTFSKCLILISFTVSLIISAFQYYDVDNSKKPTACTGSSSRSQQMKPLPTYSYCTIGCLTIIVYTFVVIAIKGRAKRYNSNTSGLQAVQINWYKVEVQAAKVITAVVATNVLFLIIPNIVLAIVTTEGLLKYNDIGQYTSVLAACNSAVNVFLYIFVDKQIRRALCKQRVHFIK